MLHEQQLHAGNLTLGGLRKYGVVSSKMFIQVMQGYFLHDYRMDCFLFLQ